MNIGIVIQARMGSTRLPGKILRQFYGEKSLLETLLDNLRKVGGIKVIVATSINETDDQLESFLNDKGVLVFRGSENDVLDRYIKAAEVNNIDGIVRICSDNPFLDWRGVVLLVEKAYISSADYIGFSVNNRPSILSHFGFWGEFVRLSALRHVAETAKNDTSAHEHVTSYIYNHQNEYRCEWIPCPIFLQGREDIRLTIDTFEDFVNASEVYSTLKAMNENFTLRDVVDYIDSHDKIRQSMKLSIIQNIK